MATFIIPIAPLIAVLVVLIRVGFLVAMIPIFGDRGLPVRVRAILVIALTAIMAPVAVPRFVVVPDSLFALGIGLIPEALIGFTFGLIGRLMFGSVQFAGQLAGREMGFAMANEIDPSSGVSITVIGQVQVMMGMLLFFCTGAYLVFFEALADSFRAIPPFGAKLDASLFDLMNHCASRMFYYGLKINFPLIGTIICVNTTFAMLAKAVPSLNIMMESFPVRILCGLAVMAISVPFAIVLVIEALGEMSQMVRQAGGLLAP